MKTGVLKAAFLHTVPVLTGYVFLGIAFGVLLSSKGYNFGWAVLMSVFIYAGAMQFVSVNLLAGVFNPVIAFIMALMVNARHIFYGLSMLDKFHDMGKRRPFMIFSLTDETFSLLCSAKVPEGVDKDRFYFYIALLDYLYWITGSAVGGIVGSLFSFNFKGIDFVMTALFVVIFVDQWKSVRNHIPAVVGIFGSLLSLIVFGAESFLLPSMIIMLTFMTLFRKPIERRNT